MQRVNNQIRVPQVRLLDEENNLGILDIKEALRLAKEKNLDLVEINPKANPPVCKIMDFGKFKFEEKKKISESKKHQKIQELKQINFKPNIEEADLLYRLEQAKSFLKEKDRVKFSIRFRGREIMHFSLSRVKLTWLISELNDLIQPNSQITLEGKVMSVIVSPK